MLANSPASCAPRNPMSLHLIAMKPVVLGGIASAHRRHAAHGHAHDRPRLPGHLAHPCAPRLARSMALMSAPRHGAPRQLADGREPRGSGLPRGRQGTSPADRVTTLGGAGIDPRPFRRCRSPMASPPVAAFVGRMILPKGVDILMAAADVLRRRGVPLAIELYGRSDEGNLEAIPPQCARVLERRRAHGAGSGSRPGHCRRLAPRCHLRAAGPQPRRHAAGHAGGGSLRPSPHRHGRARLPPFRARGHRGPDRPARRCPGAGRGAGDAGLRPRAAAQAREWPPALAFSTATPRPTFAPGSRIAYRGSLRSSTLPDDRR